MTAELLALLLANLAYFLIGAGLFFVVGFVDVRPSTWWRLPAAYLFGVACVVVPASYLALAGLGVGWTAIAAIAFVVLAAAVARTWRSPARTRRERRRRRQRVGRIDGALAAVLLCLVGIVFVYAGRAMAVMPLLDWDGWALWAAKARLLYENPADAPEVLRAANYGHPTYPIAMPVLEALGFRAMGRFDGTIIDLQLLALVGGLVAAMWTFTRAYARTAVVALVALAVVTAPQVLLQLSTNYVDIPLAAFVAAALLAAAYWLVSGPEDGTWALACLVAFAGMASLMKNEGLLFAVAACAALVLTAGVDRTRSARKPLLAAGGVLALAVPWRLYISLYDLPTYDYDLSNLVDPGYLADRSDRVVPVLRELVSEIISTGRWGLVVPGTLFALAVGLLGRRWALTGFAVSFGALSFVGLTMIYWVSVLPLEPDLFNSSYRTVATLVIGSACLTPLLVGDTLGRASRIEEHDEPAGGSTRADGGGLSLEP